MSERCGAEAWDEIERLRTITTKDAEVIKALVCSVVEKGTYLRRYRLAWISARRRAADEANFAMEALELRDQEIFRLRAVLEQRESTYAARLEYVGEDEDGEVFRLA